MKSILTIGALLAVTIALQLNGHWQRQAMMQCVETHELNTCHAIIYGG